MKVFFLTKLITIVFTKHVTIKLTFTKTLKFRLTPMRVNGDLQFSLSNGFPPAAAFISLWLSQAFVGVTDNIEIIF